ncbi:MFS transporter [Francisella sp. 19X1-34]|uniref:MFS transporter n=1 Tax=Francisella sp. 19X1-34 TaxID=3087177 RepID=UPI002E360A66|nr:MFS transporter [Francisella sp. 19X1-34]MED7787456.1 MFS transporter [Francisella sp. 19X1-34]
MKLKLRNYFAYGLGDVFGGGAFTLIGTFFLIFLTNNVGLSPWLAGLIFGLGRFWLAIVDPIVGNLSDRIRSRFGRRRVFFLIGFIPILFTFIPLWMTPMHVNADHSNESHVFIYYLVMYCVFDFIYSILDTPYASLAADMSHDYKERVYLSAFRMGSSQFSAILSTAIAPLLLVSFSYSAKAYVVMATVFAILYASVWVIVFLGTSEIPPKNNYKEKSLRWFMVPLSGFISFFSAIKNKTFRYHLGLYLFAFAGLDILMSFSAYYINVYLDKPELMSYVSSMWIVQLIVLPVYIFIASKYSKATAYRIGACIWFLAVVALINLTPENASPFTVSLHFGLIGLGLSACYVMPMTMLSFVTEVDTLMSCKRRTGIYAGAMSFARKFSQGVLILPGIGLLLTVIGYKKNAAVQTPETLFYLHWVFVLVPLVLIVIGFLFSLKFAVNRRNFHLLQIEVNRLELGDTAESDCHSTRDLCRKVTGKSYRALIDTWREFYSKHS